MCSPPGILLLCALLTATLLAGVNCAGSAQGVGDPAGDTRREVVDRDGEIGALKARVAALEAQLRAKTTTPSTAAGAAGGSGVANEGAAVSLPAESRAPAESVPAPASSVAKPQPVAGPGSGVGGQGSAAAAAPTSQPPAPGVPASVTTNGPRFTIKDAAGKTLGSGSIGSADNPYMRANSFNITAWAIGDVDNDPALEVVLIGCHNPYYPGHVLVVDADGSFVAEYWNPGHVYSLLLHDMNGDGVKEIFVGCTNNDQVPTGNNFNVPAVFALDARTMKGEAPPRSGMVGSGVEIWYTFLNEQAVEGIQQLEVVGKTLFCRSQKEGQGSTYAVDVSTGRLGG